MPDDVIVTGKLDDEFCPLAPPTLAFLELTDCCLLVLLVGGVRDVVALAFVGVVTGLVLRTTDCCEAGVNGILCCNKVPDCSNSEVPICGCMTRGYTVCADMGFHCRGAIVCCGKAGASKLGREGARSTGRVGEGCNAGTAGRAFVGMFEL